MVYRYLSALILSFIFIPGIAAYSQKPARKVVNWENEIGIRYFGLQKQDTGYFTGLGFSDGSLNPDDALSDAELDAMGQLTETIGTWIKVVSGSVKTSSINPADREKIIESLHQVSVSFSQSHLKNIDFKEIGRFKHKDSYYVAIYAKTSIQQYLSIALNYVGIPETVIIHQLFRQADSLYYKMITHEIP